LFQSAIDFEEYKEEKRDKLRKHNLCLQPFVGVVGDKDNPQQFLVCVDEFFYEVSSVLKAVDVVFKCFLALDTSYPAEASPLWQFLQRAVYGIELPTDQYFVSVDRLVEAYKQFKNC